MNKMLTFTANWCGPCQNMKSTISLLINKYPEQVFAYNIDTAEAKPLMETYGVKVVPTYVVLDENEKILSRVTGGISYEGLEKLLLNE